MPASQPIERNYEFRRRLSRVHRPGRRDPAAAPGPRDWLLETGVRIVIRSGAPPVIQNTARDLQDYLLTSLGVSALLVETGAPARAVRETGPAVFLGTRRDWPAWGRGLDQPGSYRLIVEPGRAVVCGCDARGASQGSFYLESLMNLREAPILERQDTVRKPLFSPRMTHSGWGLDRFPDAHLNAIAHSGFDSILVFTKGVDRTTHGYLDFNDLVDRAAGFGLDVYFYSYLKSPVHPADPGAAAYYESTYGELFKACPRARGVILVGESVEFPSRDERTTGRLKWDPAPDELPQDKPSPGWWPCRDYPQWIDRVKRAVRRYSPQADIVFWTYNWGWAPEKDRLALINALPRDITLQVTFEMFEPVRHGPATHVSVDYTLSQVGPGRYFRSEAAAARRRRIRLYTMCNTGGLTWDFGVVPYEPAPFQWARRYEALLAARRRWGLSGLMESHHYGWWPSFVSELANGSFWEPARPLPERAQALVRRDYGAAAAPGVLRAWQAWSEAIGRDYIATNEDQYGPFRVGPSFPLVFHANLSRTAWSKPLQMPAAWHAHFGSRIVFSFYRPMEDDRQSPGALRAPVELKALGRLAARWRGGVRALERALPLMPAGKRPAGDELLTLGRFIERMILTARNVKEWWLLNQRLLADRRPRAQEALLDALEAVARCEMENARATLPLVERDSRLGWEPSMEYMTDPAHLRWKLNQVQRVLDVDLPEYRRAIRAGARP